MKWFGLFVFCFVLAVTAAPNRLVLSFVKSNEVRQLGGYLPMNVTVFDDRRNVLSERMVENINRANSYEIVEVHLLEWDDFVIGAGVFVKLEIGAGSSVPYLVGETEVRYRTLVAQDQAVVTLPLSGGEAGFRLVNTDETNAVTGPASFKLGLNTALLNDLGINRVFPSTSFRCFASLASFPNATSLEGSFVATIPRLGLTQYNVLTPVSLTVTIWNPVVLGQILVCGIYQNDSLNDGIYRLNDLGLGVITIDVRKFNSFDPNFALQFDTPAFTANVGACPACPFPEIPSTASQLAANVMGLIALAVLVVLTV